MSRVMNGGAMRYGKLSGMPIHAQYSIVAETNDSITIKDIGHKYNCPTVTNDAQWVVRDMYLRRSLGIPIRPARLFYYDSEGRLDELLHDGYGNFTGFAPVLH
jgi:hypothetical protein